MKDELTTEDSGGTAIDPNINQLNTSSIKVVKKNSITGNKTSLTESSSISATSYVIKSLKSSSKDDGYQLELSQMEPNTIYEISYETSYDHDLSSDFALVADYKCKNRVTADTTNENGKKISSEASTEQWFHSVNIAKSGTYDDKTKTIQWTITVNNPLHFDLKGVRLSDIYKGTALTSDQIYNGNVTIKTGESVTSITNKKFLSYSFPADSTSDKYEFIYQTMVDDADAGKYISNQASLHTPDGNHSKKSGETKISIPSNTPDTPDSPIKKEGLGAVSAGNVVINNWKVDFKLLDPNGSGQCEFYDDLGSYQYFTQSQIQDIYNKIQQQYSGEFILTAYPYVYENGIMTDNASNNGIIWPSKSQEKFKKISVRFLNVSQSSETEIAFDYQSSADPERLSKKDDATTFTNSVGVPGHNTSASNQYYPDFPTIEKLDGNNQSQSSTNYEYSQLQNHMLKWLIRCHLRDYHDGDLTITDTIPEGLKADEVNITLLLNSSPWTTGYANVDLTNKNATAALRDGSGNSVGDAYHLQTKVDGGKITIVFPEALINYINKNVKFENRWNKYIDISVSCQIPEDTNWSKVYQDGTYVGVQKYLNKAEMTYGDNHTAKASHEITVQKDESNKVLNKVYDGINHGSAGISNILKYTVHINPDAAQLIADGSDHSTLTFTDLFTASYDLNTNGAVSFKLDSITFNKVKGEGDVSGITQKTGGQTVAANGSSTQRTYNGTITLDNVPDKTAIDLTYTYKIFGEKATTLTNISNTATLNGGTRVANSTTKTENLEIKKASAAVEFHDVTFVKVSSDDNAVKLPGAQFQLSVYDPNISAVSDDQKFKKIENGTYQTDNNGSFIIRKPTPNTYYRLVETTAPSGYQIDNTPFYFYVQSSDLTQYPLAPINLGNAQIHIFSGGDSQNIENTPIKQIIHLTKVDAKDTSKVLSGAEFSLYTDSGCTQAVSGMNRLVSDKNGVLKDSNGNDSFTLLGGTYYLKETKAPEGYDLLKKALVVYVDQNGVKVTDEDGKALSDASIGDNQTIIIKNSVKSYELPKTGGTGTTMIYVAGGVLVAVAVVMFVMQKRKRG
ncbi:MAG: SpaA isopeptide-forming pilin-related protein [Lactimicrobium massiliense]|nr:SpaA isopeptide-forming pilin-related protein [Lactimicrobium massiliense]